MRVKKKHLKWNFYHIMISEFNQLLNDLSFIVVSDANVIRCRYNIWNWLSGLFERGWWEISLIKNNLWIFWSSLYL